MAQFVPDLQLLRNLQDKVVVLTGCLAHFLYLKAKADSNRWSEWDWRCYRWCLP